MAEGLRTLSDVPMAIIFLGTGDWDCLFFSLSTVVLKTATTQFSSRGAVFERML